MCKCHVKFSHNLILQPAHSQVSTARLLTDTEGGKILLHGLKCSTCAFSMSPWWLTCLLQAAYSKDHAWQTARTSLMLDLACVGNTQPYLIAVPCSCREDKWIHLTISTSVHNLVMRWWSPLLCCCVLFTHAHPPMVYNPLVWIYKYHHSTKLYRKISWVCCRLYCCECAARVTMPMATNEWYFSRYSLVLWW